MIAAGLIEIKANSVAMEILLFGLFWVGRRSTQTQ
jgi:hypothetical protein